MIITTNKDWSEIQQSLDLLGMKKVVVLGCGQCAAKAGTGGTKGVETIVEQLEKNNYTILASIVLEEPCDRRIVKKDTRPIRDAIKESDGVLVLSCGVGAQNVAETLNKPVIITTNTEFTAKTYRLGQFYDYCQGCGNCILNETGGICPYTRCAKKMLNGPCGGQIDGKCEVGNYTMDCAWILIYERLKELGRLDLFTKVRSPRDWQETYKREVVW